MVSLPLASRLPSCPGPDGKTGWVPHLRAEVPGGAPAYGTPLGHSAEGRVTIRSPCSQSDTFSACQHENLFSQVLVRGWLAAPPGPPPVLPLFRQVSWLLTIPTIAPYHLSDIQCPGREQGTSACTWCLARVLLLVLEAHFLLAQHRRDLPGFWEAWVLRKHRLAFSFCLELALLKSFHVF